MEHPADKQQRQCYRELSAPVRTVPIRAYLFAVFSFAAAFLWPLKPDILPYMSLTPVVWFSCVGMIALSLSRLYGVRHAVPAPEFYIFAYALLLDLFVNHLPYPVRALDVRLLFFDYNFGYFGMVIGKLYRQSTFWGVVLGLTYNSLMLAVTALYLALPSIPVRRRFVGAVILAGTIILPLYMICPAAGPKYLLEAMFPWWPPDMSGPPASLVMPAMNAAPNGMNAIPSGHFAWALLIFWFARKHCSNGVQIAAGAYAGLTCLATFGTGEHYVVDLVLSVPFAAGIWAVVHRQWRLAGIALVMVLTWLVALREGWALAIPPLAVWLLTGMTVGPWAVYLADRNSPVPVAPGVRAFPPGNPAVPGSQAETAGTAGR
jgi:hypothetical protein